MALEQVPWQGQLLVQRYPEDKTYENCLTQRQDKKERQTQDETFQSTRFPQIQHRQIIPSHNFIRKGIHREQIPITHRTDF